MNSQRLLTLRFSTKILQGSKFIFVSKFSIESATCDSSRWPSAAELAYRGVAGRLIICLNIFDRAKFVTRWDLWPFRI